ncbi:unnamed protein product [Schistosoma curassoni]|uniref:Secreted protein n=1 Tax=Schistosoma curassoni TaxID=6186 RepID=A0A183JQ83_9TREM|nr:unnamed protein product [Schistosoma curassoni]
MDDSLLRGSIFILLICMKLLFELKSSTLLIPIRLKIYWMSHCSRKFVCVWYGPRLLQHDRIVH